MARIRTSTRNRSTAQATNSQARNIANGIGVALAQGIYDLIGCATETATQRVLQEMRTWGGAQSQQQTTVRRKPTARAKSATGNKRGRPRKQAQPELAMTAGAGSGHTNY